MLIDVIQNSFASGEIAPSIYGRTDIVQYNNAVQICRNFLPRPYGSAISMPGTRYVATVSDSTLETRLIRFVFNRNDAYAIEMGDLYMRFFTQQGAVITGGGTEDLSTYSANLKAHWLCNDNVGGTGTTTVLDAVTTHNGTASTITSTLSTTGVVSQAFNLAGLYHCSFDDHADYTRTSSTQPMTWLGWFNYSPNGNEQTAFAKPGEYKLSVNSSDKLQFTTYSATHTTLLLLHMDGTDGSSTFTDSGYLARTVTRFGNAQIDTAEKVFGTGSGLFDGTGDYLRLADHADWQLGGGTGDFTIDWWQKQSGMLNHTVISQYEDASNYWHLQFQGDGLRFDTVSSGTTTISVTSSSSLTGPWAHYAFVRDGGVFKIYKNGVNSFTSTANSTTIPNFAGLLYIGSLGGSSAYFNGWYDEFRISKYAVWTSNFTVPSSAYNGSATNTWEVDDELDTGWNFVALTCAGTGASESDVSLYVNAEAKAVTFTPGSGFTRMGDTANIFRIGAYNSAGLNKWKSMVDNIALIHQVLTASQIASLYDGSAIYQLTSPYTANEVNDVHYAQLNDVIWMAHPNHPPQKLVRTSASSWTISDAPITGGPFLDTNTVTGTTLKVTATTGTINVTAATGTILFTPSGSTLGHVNTFWMIGGTSVETDVTTGLQFVGYVKITDVINSYTATASVVRNLNRNNTNAATDNWAEGAWSSVRGYPSRVIIQGNRLWFGRTDEEPQKEWGSKIFKFENFALDTQADDDALNIGLSSNESNEIQWLGSGKSLVAGTFGGAFVTNSGSNESITPDNVTASEDIGVGSEAVMPRKLGNFIFYIQRFGKKLRELFYNWELDTYKAVDKTVLASHILEGVTDMDIQQSPETVLYCITNGNIATMTREVDQEVTGWAKHTTDGTYTSIAVIPSQLYDYDEPWVIVERWVNGSQRKYVEFFENIEVPDRQDKCLYLHSALTYDAYEVTSMSSVTISLSASSGSVTLTSSSAYFNGEMISDKLRTIDADGNTLGEGTITATGSTTSITLSITTTFTSTRATAGLWGVSVSTISGLEHLEAKTVGILADGQTESLTRTVASGSVTLGGTYFVISAGLSYDQILYTLPKEAGSQRGTSQGKWQRISEIFFKLNRSTQNFQYGPDASNLDSANLAFTPTVTTLYSGILPPQGGGIAMRGGYTRGAQVYIKNSQPLPMEVLNIMGALNTEDK